MAEISREIPEGIKVELDGKKIIVTGSKGKIEKEIAKELEVEIKEGKIILRTKEEKRKNKAILGTFDAHMRNMIKGVTTGYKYTLRMVYSHFPIKVNVEKGKVIIKNLFGEKKDRVAKIIGNVDVKVQGNEIIVSGINVDEVSQTAANIEQKTRITNKDERRFQDGIYLVSRE
ncbi:MAG: 50S ribosomal protein L6 [archaeon]